MAGGGAPYGRGLTSKEYELLWTGGAYMLRQALLDDPRDTHKTMGDSQLTPDMTRLADTQGGAVICYNTCGPELWYYQYTRGVLGEASTQGWVRADLGFDPTRAVLNGAEKPMAQPCEVHQQRTCLSIRYVAEAFGLTIQWDEGANTIHLFTPQA